MRQYILEYPKGLLQKGFQTLEGETTLGRSRENTICLTDPQISRTHARLTFQDDHWVLHDQQSRNGTFVNGRRVRHRTLKHGDRIRIGGITLRFLELENQEEFHSLLETQVSAPLGMPQEIEDHMSVVGTFLDALPIGVVILNGKMEVLYYNRALALFDLAEEWDERGSFGALLGCPICADSDVLCGVSSDCARCPLHEAAKKAFEHGTFTLEEEILWSSPDRTFPSHIHFSFLPLRYRVAGEPLALLAWEDLTRLKLAEEKLKRDAFHDTLTGLSNRALFMDRLKRCILRMKRGGDYSFAVLFIDIDRFKVINDGLGQAVGDQLLVAIGRRLEDSLRSLDTVARLGADEFAILLDDITSAADAENMAGRIQKRLGVPFRLNGQEILTTASIGIALGDTQSDAPEDFLRRAEMAMYRAKYQGKARHVIFDTEMHDRDLTLLRFETDLRQAFEQEQLMVYYQPFVDLETRNMTGAEALLRWEKTKQDFISPKEFIPVAEESGLIEPIGEWVLRTACEQNKVWQKSGFPPLRVAVNLSGRQFRQQDLLEIIKRVLKNTGLDPQFLELEITESTIMENAQASIKTLNELHSMGVKISIDDFGTGYSSLAYLKRFPIDTLKIDHSFVRDINTDPDSAAIVKAIIAMARSLQIRVIAECVETQEQLETLLSLKCDEMQGNLFCSPSPARTLTGLLQRGQSLSASFQAT